MKKNLLIGLLSLCLITFISCKKDSNDDNNPDIHPLNGMTLLNKSNSENYSIETYIESTPIMGNNVIMVRVQSLAEIKSSSNLDVELLPVMDMGTMKHSCPIIQPELMQNTDDTYRGEVVFSMPGNQDQWSMKIKVTNGGQTEEVSFGINVTSPQFARAKVVTSKIDGKKIVFALAQPTEPKVGKNELVIMAHYREDMMTHPAMDNITFEIRPWMHSMDHGSPDNINPTYVGNGKYKGTVNFTMTGDWRIHITARQDGELITDEFYFDFDF